MPLVVTSSAGLAATYGPAGAAMIEARLPLLASAIGNASVQILASGSASATPDASTLYAELKNNINTQRVQDQLRSGILIVGDHRIFPGFTLSNPVTDRSLDPDTTVLTDNPFGQFDWQAPEQALVPEISVGRVAGGVELSAEGFSALLDTMIAQRRRGSLRAGYVEITSRQWQNSSSSVLSALASPARVIVSPDGHVTPVTASMLDCKFLYCNLHGFVNDSAWRGYDDGTGSLLTAVTPDCFQPAYVSGTLAFTEACYGLATRGKATSGSCALSLLAAGAAGVIGSTGLAFGTADVKSQNLIDADLLARNFFNRALTPGSTTGGSLFLARKALQASAPASDAFVKKTLLSFQLLGDPSYVIA